MDIRLLIYSALAVILFFIIYLFILQLTFYSA